MRHLEDMGFAPPVIVLFLMSCPPGAMLVMVKDSRIALAPHRGTETQRISDSSSPIPISGKPINGHKSLWSVRPQLCRKEATRYFLIDLSI